MTPDCTVNGLGLVDEIGPEGDVCLESFFVVFRDVISLTRSAEVRLRGHGGPVPVVQVRKTAVPPG